VLVSRETGAPAAAAVHAAIDMRRFPWIRPLVAAYSSDFSSVAPLFAGNPASAEAWARVIDGVSRAPRDRGRVAQAVSRQLEQRGAPHEARDAARRLADPATVTVLVGQQAGLFGGPLYVLLKAITAIQAARAIARAHGVPVVPVFWVDSEDHDWAEVRTATVLDANFTPQAVTAQDVPGAGRHPVGSLVLGRDIGPACSQLEQALAPSEFTADTLAVIRAWYRPGTAMGTAFAGVLDRLLGPHGLVVCEAADAALKPLVGSVFVRELEQPGRTASLAREAGNRMQGLGHAPQVEPAEDAVALFYLDEEGRRPIRRREGGFAVGDRTWAAPALRAEAAAHPERFSPNVLLRPIVQDTLFPTACFVAGPSELAYQAQLGEVYRAFGVEQPLLQSRASATLLDAAALRFLDRSQMPFEALHAQDDAALNRLLESLLPPGVDRAIAEAGDAAADRVRALAGPVTAIDPTLAGALETTELRIRETLGTLQNKIVQAAKRKDETLRRQFSRTRALAFPNGQPQERALALPFFLNRYGLQLPDRLLEILPLDTDPGKHYVLQM
jgi:bacillithiol biosynthesis cysteine-adding enzyme BshC